MLSVESLHTGYGMVEAVHGASISVEKGKLASVVGANGAGKSALLLAITGILPHTGAIELNGVDLSRRRPYARAREGIALVPEGRQVFAGLTVRDNLLSGSMHGRARGERAQRLELVFDLFPRLAERQSQKADSMSGGEQQMVAIGRALMGKPQLMMLDEPSLGLAPVVVQMVFGAIERLRDEGLTILLVEQNVHHALAISDYAYVLDQGQIVLEGTGTELLSDRRVQDAYLASVQG